MIIDLDLASGTTRLLEPGTFTAFHVGVRGATPPATDAARPVLAHLGADARAVDDDHVAVSVAAVRRLAGSPGDDWEAGFAAMLDHAAGQGWTCDDGAFVRAHLEWVDR